MSEQIGEFVIALSDVTDRNSLSLVEEIGRAICDDGREVEVCLAPAAIEFRVTHDNRRRIFVLDMTVAVDRATRLIMAHLDVEQASSGPAAVPQ